MGKFYRFLIELPAHYTSVFSFPVDNLSKYQLIFIKHGMYIDIADIWFGTANGQILLIVAALSARHTIVAGLIISRF